jgi:hypothetical protein
VNPGVVIAAEQREVEQAGPSAVGPVFDVVCFYGRTGVVVSGGWPLGFRPEGRR